jgi:hypothetical protein
MASQSQSQSQDSLPSLISDAPSADSSGTPKKRVFRPQKLLNKTVESAKGGYEAIKDDTKSLANEIHVECFQTFEVYEVIDFIRANWYKLVYVPYLPAFHKPGWLLRYFVGPYNSELISSLVADFIAGITVVLTLIPQVIQFLIFYNLIVPNPIIPIHRLYLTLP